MTAMPVMEGMTAEGYLARPYDPHERGAELIGGVIVVDNRADRAPDARKFDIAPELARGDTPTSPLLPGLTVALDALFGE